MARDSERGDVVAEFDDRAPSYDTSAMHRWQAQQAAELASVQPDEHVLDVATGTGLVLRALRRAPVDPGRLVGVDVSAGMLRVARQRSLATCSYVRADGAALPFRSAVFDVIIGWTSIRAGKERFLVDTDDDARTMPRYSPRPHLQVVAPLSRQTEKNDQGTVEGASSTAPRSGEQPCCSG